MSYQNDPYNALFKKYGVNNEDDEEQTGNSVDSNSSSSTTDPYEKLYKKYNLNEDGSFTDAQKKQNDEIQRQEEEKKRVADAQAAEQGSKSNVEKLLDTTTTYALDQASSVGSIIRKGIDTFNFIKDKAYEKVIDPAIIQPLSETSLIKGAAEGMVAVEQGKVQGDTGTFLGEELLKGFENPTLTLLNTERGAKVTGAIADNSANIPLKGYAALKALGDDTYDEAYSALLAKRNDPENPRWERLLYGIQDGGVQSAVGVLLSLGATYLARNPQAGQVVGTTYFGAISAESQRDEKGEVYSATNIGIDVLGDQALSQITESVFKSILKESAGSVIKSGVKGFAVEGTTEVSQSLLKYANNYRDAKTEEEKLAAIKEANDYVRGGGLIDEFIIGGASGALVTGGAAAIAKAAGVKTPEVNPSIQPNKSAEPKPKGEPEVKYDGDFSKVRDAVANLQERVQNDPEDESAVNTLSEAQDTLNDFETAFKERPVYISDGDQESPILQIETVQYPDGKISTRFSADAKTTAVSSMFDNKNLYSTRDEAIKASAQNSIDWAQGELVNATAEEAPILERIVAEGNKILDGSAEMVPVTRQKAASISIQKTEEDILGELEKTSFGGSKEDLKTDDYLRETLPLTDDFDKTFARSQGDEKRIDKMVQEIKNGAKLPPIILSKGGAVIDGHTRVAAYQKLGIKSIDVLRVTGKGTGKILDSESTKTGGKKESVESSEKMAQESQKKDSKAVTKKSSTVKLTDTDAFKEWFGDSQVVDENGDPLIVYHGSNNKFEAFDKERVGNRDSGWFGKGFYFTISKGEAASYGSEVIAAYLKMEKPFVFSDYEDSKNRGTRYAQTHYLASLAKAVPEIQPLIDIEIADKYTDDFALQVKTVSLGEYITLVENANIHHKMRKYETDRGFETKITLTDFSGREVTETFYNDLTVSDELLKYVLFDIANKTEANVGGLYGVEQVVADFGDVFTDAIKKQGYDGTMQSREGDEYVVFEPNAIKSVDNNGDFSKDNDSMLYSASIKKNLPTLKTLETLKGRDSVSRQFIMDLTNKGEIRQAERDMIRMYLELEEGDKINVPEFVNKVQTALLPLEAKDRTITEGTRYESVSLPPAIRGKVIDYKENIYTSPVKTSAGNVHFDGQERIPNYFAHSRTEDVPGDKRRVIEVQSDLFQKDRLENERIGEGSESRHLDGADQMRVRDIHRQMDALEGLQDGTEKLEEYQALKAELETLQSKNAAIESELNTNRDQELSRLEPYRNTWHERIIREELKQAAIDGKQFVLFPTGETAMKIEGLGDSDIDLRDSDTGKTVSYEDLKAGMRIEMWRDYDTDGEEWFVTDILGDGQYKAVLATGNEGLEIKDGVTVERYTLDGKVGYDVVPESSKETFDVSGKVDTENPIYRFYEKTVQKFLKNRFNAKNVTDEQGITWVEVDISESMAEEQVLALGSISEDQNLDTLLDTEFVRSRIEKIAKEVNPNLQTMVQFEIVKKIVENGESYSGRFDPRRMMIEISRSDNVAGSEPGQIDDVIRHELEHLASTMFSRANRNAMTAYFDSLTEDDLIDIYSLPAPEDMPQYGIKKGDINRDSGKEILNGYRKAYGANRQLMIEETILWDIRARRTDSPVVKAIQKIMDALIRLWNKLTGRLNNRLLGMNARALYADVFSDKNIEKFSLSEGRLMEINMMRATSGSSNIGVVDENGFTRKRLFSASTKPKKETKTQRFVKTLSRRKELLQLKKKKEAAFKETEAGQKVILENEFAIENFEPANKEVVQGIKNNPYFKKEGSIKDSMGSGWLMEKRGRYVVIEPERLDTYVQRGYQRVYEIDSLAAEEGYDNGQEWLEVQLAKQDPIPSEKLIERMLKDSDMVYGKVLEEIERNTQELEVAKNDKGAFFNGMRVGGQMMRTKYRQTLSDVRDRNKEKIAEIRDRNQQKMRIFQQRKEIVRAAKKFFNLPEATFKKIGGARDVQYMSDAEFQGFLNHIQVQSEREILRIQAKDLVVAQIEEKQLKRYDNLRKAMKLPPIKDMTAEQLTAFDKALEDTEFGDEFFTQRQLETVRNTELKGIKTVREARQRLANRLEMDLGALSNIKVAPSLDRMRYDSALADVNPFYKLIVDETNIAELTAEARFLAIEHEANKLIKKARKSRRRSIADRLVPKDDRIFEYLESSDKESVAKDMTTEEVEAAEFIRRMYEEMRDYLVAAEQLASYKNDYITHVRRDFLETWRDDGIIKAFSSILEQQQEEAAVFNILSGDTGEILPLEKFFQFSLKRTGELTPTQNVAKAFLTYVKTFEKKRALDGLIPKLDIYTYAIEPKRKTSRGLLMDRSLKKFLNEWLNNKKGRKFDFGGYLRQGGKLDLTLRGIRAFTTILDLGLSVPAGIASNVGEQVTDFVSMGALNYTKGTARMGTFKGRRIVKKYRNFIGKNPWVEFFEISQNAGDRFGKALFILFRDAQVRANEQYLLGMMSPEEYKNEEIDPKRLAEMKREMGRWRVVEGAKSIAGSTSAGGIITQYKTWAVPIFRTTIKDIETLAFRIKTGDIRALYSREGAELFRSIVVMGGLALFVKAWLSSGKDEEKKKSFAEKLIDKSIRDLMSTIGVFDPTFFLSEPRVISFLGDMSEAMKSIITWEQYTDDGKTYEAGDLKGVEKIQKTVTPNVMKQFNAGEDAPTKKEVIQSYMDQGLNAEAAAKAAEQKLELDPTDPDYQTQVRALEKAATQEETVQATGKKTERILQARLKTTKVRILNEYKKEMGEQAFNDYIWKLYEGKVISRPVMLEFVDL